MSFLNNIRLKSKLFAVVAFLIAVSLGISAAVYQATRDVAEHTEEIMHSSERLHIAGRATANLLAFVRYVEFLPLELTTDQRKDFEAKAEDELRRLRERIDQFKPAVEAGRIELDQFRNLLARYDRDVFRVVQKLSREKDLDGATKVAFVGDQSVIQMRNLLRGLEDRNVGIYRTKADALTAEQAGLLREILMIAGFGCLMGLLAAFTTIVMGITKPLMSLIATMKALASGKSDVNVPGTDRKDEIGDMARTVEVFRENAIDRSRLEGEMRRERDRERARQERIDGLITVFRGSIGDIRQSLDLQLDTLQNTSVNLGRIAGEAAEGASTAGNASRDASTNVNSVASAAGELTAASREISTQVHKASESVTEAMAVAERADHDISSLALLAERIGAIVDIINSIAEQTNMLALNATIEAARAGEAGRSFAVVASEVKTLAGQTAKATDEISAQVSAIQAATQQAVASIRTITNQVSEIQGRTTAIAAAVEEQEASTHEISRAISLASEGSNRVAGSVTTMAHSVDQTSIEAGQLRTTFDLLADVAGKLTNTVDGFLQSVAEDVVERRRAARQATRQIGLVNARGRRVQTMILDISPHGIKIEAVPDLRLGDLIEIEWSSGERFRGRPVWMKNGQAGIELMQELPAELIAAAA
jgi:methyl-accepting chemotaxis protein